MNSRLMFAVLCWCLSSFFETAQGAKLLDLPPRYMWGWSPPAWAVGYCGSMSLQTVGLYYGNWITQDAARGTNGGHGPKNSLLLGGHHENDTHPSSESHALRILHFNHSSWGDRHQSKPQHTAFLKWARVAIDAGEPVIFGVYMRLLHDVDYDHIVPMVGYDANNIFFNDLHANHTLRYAASEFVQSRETCSGGTDDFRYCLPKFVDYGIRIHGNFDLDGVLIPVRLRMDSWSEPDYSREDAHQEKPIELHGTVIIKHMQPGAHYVLLRFEDAASVPQQNFLQGNFTSRQDFVSPTTGQAQFRTKFLSNSTVFYRCVRKPSSPDASSIVV